MVGKTFETFSRWNFCAHAPGRGGAAWATVTLWTQLWHKQKLKENLRNIVKLFYAAFDDTSQCSVQTDLICSRHMNLEIFEDQNAHIQFWNRRPENNFWIAWISWCIYTYIHTYEGWRKWCRPKSNIFSQRALSIWAEWQICCTLS